MNQSGINPFQQGQSFQEYKKSAAMESTSSISFGRVDEIGEIKACIQY